MDNHPNLLRFSNDYILVEWMESPIDYLIEGKAIVVNLGINDMTFYNQNELSILRESRKTLKQWESSIFTDITIKSADLILIIKSELLDQPDFSNKMIGEFPELQEKTLLSNFIVNEEVRQQVIDDKWEYAGDLYPSVAGKHLWKTKEELIDMIGPIEFDPYFAVRQSDEIQESRKKKFMVKCYMWFSPKLSHCGIHNNHNYIEIHTQVSGCGRIPKFLEKDKISTMYEDNRMAPGHTLSEAFCQLVPDNSKPQGINFVYPWHEYYSDTDCIWLVSEFHPVEDE